MYTSTLLLTTLAALATCSPISTRSPNTFHISNFVFGCTASCSWNYDISVSNDAANHPATGPIHCAGTINGDTSFEEAADACDFISDVQKLSTFIDENRNLQVQYKYSNVSAGSTYWYEGNTPVNAVTSGRPQATDFDVEETKAYGIAK